MTQEGKGAPSKTARLPEDGGVKALKADFPVQAGAWPGQLSTLSGLPSKILNVSAFVKCCVGTLATRPVPGDPEVRWWLQGHL